MANTNSKSGLYLCRTYKNSKGRTGRQYNFDGKRVAVAHETAANWRIDFSDKRESVKLDSLDACDKYMKKLYKGVPSAKVEAAPTRKKAKVEAEAKALGDIRGAELKSKASPAPKRAKKSKKAEPAPVNGNQAAIDAINAAIVALAAAAEALK